MKKTILCLLSVVLIIGCYKNEEASKFKVHTEGDTVLRLNTQTGEIIVFSHDGIQKYDDDYIQERYKQNSSLSELKSDDSQAFPESDGVMWTKMRYKWRNDKILFQYSFGPYSSELEKLFSSTTCNITLNFLDLDGFEIISKDINLGLLTRIVNEKGEPSIWQKTGEVPCTKDDYKLINSYTYLWNFSKEAKSQIKQHCSNIKTEREMNYAKVKKLIEDKRILGEIDQNKIYLKGREGFKEIKEDNYELIAYIVENTEYLRTKQNEFEKSEQTEKESESIRDIK